MNYQNIRSSHWKYQAYEPYSGTRLTTAREKLAALVLRCHRLVELFLVEVMGMSWAEVHDEAEKLEHVVSDRLIERIDRMLGQPADDQQLTIGTRAASKLLVQLARIVLIILAWTSSARAQGVGPFEIIDNSFLIEEAFNQEPGVFQNILTFERAPRGEWETVFTQEWPLARMTHQISYTIPFSGSGGKHGVGDVLVNYRFQATTETGTRPAFAPRFSVILPSGNEKQGLGNGVLGWQVNLPFSKQVGDLYAHWNAGVTQFPNVITPGDSGREDTTATLVNWNLGASAIWRVRPMINLMLEGVAEFVALPAPFGQTTRAKLMTIAPGIRGGRNIGDAQFIVGVTVPFSFAHNDPLSRLRQEAFNGFGIAPPLLDDKTAILAYFSYELPFKKH